MKKRISLFIFLILIFPIISAIEFDIKEEYAQGETIIARVSGSFLQPVLKESINFYRGHVKIPIVYDVAKINNEFYIYAQLLGRDSGNYSIVIENARYREGAGSVQEDITKNFTINENIADFAVDPGFVITTDSFNIEVQNLQDTTLTITAKTNEEKGGSWFNILFGDERFDEKEVEVLSGDTETIYFDLNEINYSVLGIVEIETANLEYEIPVYLLLEEEPENETGDFKFVESKINLSLSTEFSATRTIRLENLADKIIKDIDIYMSDALVPYVNLSDDEVSRLREGDLEEIELTFLADEEEKTIEGQITARSGDLYAYLPIYLTFVKDYIPEIPDNETEVFTSKNCAEIDGIICESNEECTGQSVYAKDGNCCLESCQEVKKSSSSKWLGWTIIILIVVFVAWFFKNKYMGTSRKIPF